MWPVGPILSPLTTLPHGWSKMWFNVVRLPHGEVRENVAECGSWTTLDNISMSQKNMAEYGRWTTFNHITMGFSKNLANCGRSAIFCRHMWPHLTIWPSVVVWPHFDHMTTRWRKNVAECGRSATFSTLATDRSFWGSKCGQFFPPRHKWKNRPSSFFIIIKS